MPCTPVSATSIRTGIVGPRDLRRYVLQKVQGLVLSGTRPFNDPDRSPPDYSAGLG